MKFGRRRYANISNWFQAVRYSLWIWTIPREYNFGVPIATVKNYTLYFTFLQPYLGLSNDIGHLVLSAMIRYPIDPPSTFTLAIVMPGSPNRTMNQVWYRRWKWNGCLPALFPSVNRKLPTSWRIRLVFSMIFFWTPRIVGINYWGWTPNSIQHYDIPHFVYSNRQAFVYSNIPLPSND